jgi:hypothetical protein
MVRREESDVIAKLISNIHHGQQHSSSALILTIKIKTRSSEIFGAIFNFVKNADFLQQSGEPGFNLRGLFR